VALHTEPFSGHIRPGDILNIEIVGGLPDTKSPATRTVEPDGNVVLGAVYGSTASRVKVAGLTLIEAGQAITEQLRDVLRNPQVVVTYEGHDEGVVSEGAPAAAAISQPAPANAEPVVLQPLDTIEIIVPLSRTRAYLSDSFGKPAEVFAGKNPPVSGTYVIEPDGRVALPEAGGRVKLAGLNETEASKRLREHLSAHLFPRLALPSVTVLRRGRAVFPEGKQPTADYRIAPGDTVLASTYLPLNVMVIDAEGRFPLDSSNGKPVEKVSVAGLTLEEAQAALRKAFVWKAFPVSNVAGSDTDQTAPWILTLGGWHEEADPQVIDRIEGTDATQLLRMQEEMEELKSMIQRLQAK
jgi:protein involved in polysaccharide export with SLBB domain